MPNRPKPVERKRAAGNPGKRPLPEPRTVVPALETAPKPPRGLKAAGRDLWKQVWDYGSGWLAPSDAPIVGLVCSLVDERAQWAALVAKGPKIYTTKTGVRRAHPAAAEVRAIDRQLIMALSLMGFTPSDRSRLGLSEVRKISALADLLERRKDAI